MTRFHKTSVAILLAVAVLALGACGGDDEGNGGSTDTGAAAPETTGTTGTTTGTTDTRTSEDGNRTGKTDTSERNRDDKGGGGGNSGSGKGNSGSGGGGSDDSSGSGGGNAKPAETELTAQNVKKTAKTVCMSFLPTQVAKDLKSGKKSAQDVAEDYSKGFPAAQRKNAYEGCLAGLKAND